MLKSKEILLKKAQEVKSLRDEIKEEKKEETADIYPQAIYEKGKKVLVFKDPLFSAEKRSTVIYSIFNGKWEFENIENTDSDGQEFSAAKFKPVKDGSDFILAFKSLKDRVDFMNSIYANNALKQTGGGMNLEKLANSKIFRATSGIVGLSIIGYNLIKLVNRNLKRKKK